MKIGDIVLEAEQIVELTNSADVLKHPVEQGFKIDDHILIRPRRIRIDATLIGKEKRYADYQKLKEKMDAREPFDFVSPMGAIPNCVITHISPKREDSENTLSCTIELQEIRIATIAITTITPVTDPVTGIIINPVTKGSEATTSPKSELPLMQEAVQEEPEEDESWLDTIWNGITSTATAISTTLFGWLS